MKGETVFLSCAFGIRQGASGMGGVVSVEAPLGFCCTEEIRMSLVEKAITWSERERTVAKILDI
jgi:hypothetical protein